MAGRGEFDLIADLFAPLTSSTPAALGLKDDAAVFSVPEGFDLVTTVDAMVEDVHFFPADAANLVARKLLRVNLSDLAAMGAKPIGYLLTLVRPSTVGEDWLQRFAHGLAADQRTFNIGLLGGDTVSTAGPLVLSLTALGQVAAGKSLLRSGANPGDTIYVSGTIGDAGLGLALVQDPEGQGFDNVSRDDRNALVARLQCPEPRLELGQALAGVATAAVDISDGLVADLAHIASASDVGMKLVLSDVPVSDAAARIVGTDENSRLKLIAGGEDYELAFTAPESTASRIRKISKDLELSITPIGTVTAEKIIEVRGQNGDSLPVTSSGWTHF